MFDWLIIMITWIPIEIFHYFQSFFSIDFLSFPIDLLFSAENKHTQHQTKSAMTDLTLAYT